MTVAGFMLCIECEIAIKKLIAKDASWSRILAKRLQIAVNNYKKENGLASTGSDK